MFDGMVYSGNVVFVLVSGVCCVKQGYFDWFKGFLWFYVCLEKLIIVQVLENYVVVFDCVGDVFSYLQVCCVLKVLKGIVDYLDVFKGCEGLFVLKVRFGYVI